MRKLVIIGLALLVLIALVFWKFAPQFNKSSAPDPNAPATLTVWGLWENESLFKTVIDNYKKLHPNIKINYIHQNSLNYRTRVQTQVLNKQGPDIFMIHNSWVPMFLKTQALSSAPDNIITTTEFNKTFYPVAK